MSEKISLLKEANRRGLLKGKQKEYFDLAVSRGLIQIDSEPEPEDKGGMGKAFGAGVDKLQELGYRAVKGFTDVGNEGDGFLEQDGALSRFAQRGIDENIEEQKAYEPTVPSYKDVNSIGSAASYAGELVANSLPYMAGAITPVGAGAMAGGLSQEAYETQPEDEKNALRATASGVGQMALERLGIKGSMGEIGKDILKDGVIATAKRYQKGEFIRAAKDPKTALAFSKRVLKGALWEGATESAQESLAMWGAGKDFEEFEMLSNEKYSKDILGADGQALMESFVGGATVGGIIRTGSEGVQKLVSWQQKSAPIAKNGIDELVKQGVTQEEAIEQVSKQIIASGMKQGLSEAEAAAAAARTMKTEYDIDHEIFTPVANDVASRRKALYEKLERDRIEGGFGRVQESIKGEGAPSAEALVQQQMRENDPAFFENLNNQVKPEEGGNIAEKSPEVTNITETEEKLPKGKGNIANLEVVEAPVGELSLSNDVPQFKSGANDKGVVEPLGGKFDRTGVSPIQVWVRKDGRKEVISGRHRTELAQRSGEQTIPAQYHYEENGFDKYQAAALDAILNVREGQGKVKDYVDFIKHTGLTEAEANEQGILARATGKRAYTIASQGSDPLIAAHRNNGITDEAAVRIAKAAPNDEALQAVGIKAIDDGKTITVAENLAKAASKKQAEIQRSLSAIQGAAKRPELAAKEGVNVKDPKAVKKRIEQLKDEKRQWDNWHTNPELVAQLKDKPDINQEQTPQATASQEAVVVSEAIENDATVTDKGSIPQAPDMFGDIPNDKPVVSSADNTQASTKQPDSKKAEVKKPEVKESPVESKGVVVNFSSHKTVEDKVSAWFGIKPGDTIIDSKGAYKGTAFDTPKGRVIKIQNKKGEFESFNAVAIAGKDGIIQGIDKAASESKNPVKEDENKIKQDIKPEAKPAPVKANDSRSIEDSPISDDVLNSFETALDAVNWLEINAKEPAFKEIAKKIKGAIDPSVKFVMSGDGQRVGGVLKGRYSYKERDNEIIKNQLEIYDQGKVESTLIHELIHVATSRVIRNPKTTRQKEAVSQLNVIKREIDALRMLERDQWSTLTEEEQTQFRTVGLSRDEFVTYTLTNKHFQNGLKKLSYKSEKESLFVKLGGVIKSLLGLDNTPNSVFARAIDATSAIIEVAELTDTLKGSFLDSETKPTITIAGDIVPDSAKDKTKAKSEKITDFGDVLEGAAKHTYSLQETLDEDIDVEALPLSKSFPHPDYEQLSSEGVDHRILALISALRAKIKTKPRKGYKLAEWVKSVEYARSATSNLIKIKKSEIDATMGAELNKKAYDVGFPVFLSIAKELDAKYIKELGHYSISKADFVKYNDEENVSKWLSYSSNKKGGMRNLPTRNYFDTKEKLKAFVISQITETFESKGQKLAKFDVWTERGHKGVYFVGKKLAANKYIELKRFDNRFDALESVAKDNAELVAMLKNKRSMRDTRKASNDPRVGIDHRKNADITPEKFNEAFGFRGVQFGNWVEGDRRQQDLNNAYDGLMDLASILNIPSKALSLNGELGLAFGARGRGGANAAMAHYEPDGVNINLTKKMGAGSLAHEWFHALDNYFAKNDQLDSGKLTSGAYMTEHSRKRGFVENNKYRDAEAKDFAVRKEVYDAFKGIKKMIEQETELVKRSAKMDSLRPKNYWSTVREMTARTFERYVIEKLAESGYESDYLANIVSESDVQSINEALGQNDSYVYPLLSEMDAVNKAYDNLFNTLETKETDKGLALFSADTSIKVSPNKVTLKEAQNIVNEFQQEYNGNIPLEFRVVEKQEQLYGPESTVEKVGLIKGTYHPKTGVFGVTSSNMQNRADGQATLRHEILGHYGLNTFKPADKKAILQRVINNKNHASLKAVWSKVDENYPELDAMGRAEEVFAILAEKPPTNTSLWSGLVVLVRKALRSIGIGKGSITKAEIESYIQDIAKSIKSGEAKQQTFPDTDQEQFRSEGSPLNSNPINIQDETRKDAILRRIQDKFRRLKVIQRELSVNENSDAYMAEEAFHGKVGEDLRKLENEHTDKIAKIMADNNLSQDEVDLYLIAKHAQERNAYIDTINPELNGAGSGMSNQDAQAILDKAILEGSRLKLEEVANQVYAMLRQNREMMVGFGLEAQDAINTWQSQYQYYVPLKGYAVEEDTRNGNGKKFGTGKGFNIKGRETIKAMGRRSLAESPLLHTISDTTQAIIRARKNEVGNTFLKLVNSNPDKELWQTFTGDNPDKKRGELPDGTIGQVNMTAFEMKASDEYFKTKVDGNEHFIKIHDPMLLQAMNNLGVDQMGALTRVLGVITRTLSALVTTWNPEFMLTNFTRDVQAAVANVLAETQVADGKAVSTENLAKKMIKSLPKAMATLKRGFRDNNFDDGEWGSYLKEFLESGAKTGWVNQKDIEALANELKSTISRASNTKVGKTRRAGKAIADFVSDYNDIVENSARFSVYYHARKQGISLKQASSLAKNLTINFNRKGEIGATMNALFMFSNASIQGTANMLRALATPKERSKSMWNPEFYNLSQKLAIGSIGATVLMANVMRVIGGDDEDGESFYDKVPDHVKATNFVIMTGGENYVAIPMPYGYNFLAGVGHALDGLIEGKSLAKQATKIALSTVSTFSPLGLSESDEASSSLLKMAAPTVLKPLAEMAIDENFFGGHIYPDDRGYSVKKADANRGTKYTWELSKNFTSWLNEATGGSEFRSGFIDFAPQSIDHLVKFMGGGVLQFGMRWQNLASKAMDGKDIESKDVPFARRFYKQINPKQSFGEFYDAKDQLAKYKADLDGLKSTERSKYIVEYKDHLTLNSFALSIDKNLRQLNKNKRSVESSKLSETSKEDKLQRIDDKKLELVMRFSKRRNELGLKNIH